MKKYLISGDFRRTMPYLLNECLAPRFILDSIPQVLLCLKTINFCRKSGLRLARKQNALGTKFLKLVV